MIKVNLIAMKLKSSLGTISMIAIELKIEGQRALINIFGTLKLAIINKMW